MYIPAIYCIIPVNRKDNTYGKRKYLKVPITSMKEERNFSQEVKEIFRKTTK
jgi:hypothetical protein